MKMIYKIKMPLTFDNAGNANQLRPHDLLNRHGSARGNKPKQVKLVLIFQTQKQSKIQSLDRFVSNTPLWYFLAEVRLTASWLELNQIHCHA